MRKTLLIAALLTSACSGGRIEPTGDLTDEDLGATGSSGSSTAGVDGSTSGSGSGGSSASSSAGGSSGTTGLMLGDGSLCAPCTTDLDCGEEGLGFCDDFAGIATGACTPTCSTDDDCDPNAHCVPSANGNICFPKSGTCAGYVPGDDDDDSTGSTGSASSSSASSSSSSSASSSSGSTGGSSSSTGSTGSHGSSSGSSSGSSGSHGSSSGSSTGSSGSTGIGPGGGTVDRLHFAVTGDTRPPGCDATQNYPTAVFTHIVNTIDNTSAQFALDLGDHMFVCNNKTSTAKAQMNLFMGATAHFHGTWFMTEGNHECMGGGSNGHCNLQSTNANYNAFMDALAPIASKPYYSFTVHTSMGKAVFVVVADNSWTTAQKNWLEATLTDADAHAKYTIIARHHPQNTSSLADNAAIMQVIRAHKFALLLTGHAHAYGHGGADQGRDVILGISGAPLDTGSTYHGYAMVDQKANGDLKFTVYDVATNAAMDTWTVGPN